MTRATGTCACPAASTDTRGITWADGVTPGRSIPIGDFVIAKPGDSIGMINSQLAKGKHLLLTPGVYDVASSIQVKRADTVVLGMGHATLTAVDGAVPLKVADASGIVVAGVTIDAGLVQSPMLLEVGKPGKGKSKSSTRRTRSRCPTCTSGSAARTSARPTPRSS